MGKTRFYAYDAVGNLTKLTDRNGRVRQFDYNTLDHPVEERRLDRGQQTIHTLDFTYDVGGRKSEKQTP